MHSTLNAWPVLQASSLAAEFGWLDWGVVVAYLVVTTLIGGALAGKQATIRDFFLGGRKLPWYAVAGSIVATEISAVTFVGVPAIVFAATGNFTFLQIALIGYTISRIVVAIWFVPAYYAQDIYSPYDFMSDRLGPGVREMTTFLFMLGGMLAQGVRVYLTAMILDLIIGVPMFGWIADLTGTDTMAWSIVLIGVVAVAWTLMGGITTVIWTDLILFIVFLGGAVAALLAVLLALPGDLWVSFGDMIDLGLAQAEAGPSGKLTMFDFSFALTKPYTFWAAVFGASCLGVAIFGTDQLMAQRMFCCRDAKQARIAMLASTGGQVITVLMMFIGLGLFAYYQHYPLSVGDAALVAEKSDRIFPIFIVRSLPPGITGLLIGAIFAAAISSLDSILAALSQTTISAFYLPFKRSKGVAVDDEAHDRSLVRVSRVLVVFWGVVLCTMAYVADAATQRVPQILNLALGMAGYAGGALLAGFVLALWFSHRGGRGFLFAAPLSVLTVFAVAWHEPWSHWVCLIGGGGLLLVWLGSMFSSGIVAQRGAITQSAFLAVGIGGMIALNYGLSTPIAWPWYVPIGASVAFVFGVALGTGSKDKA